MKLYIQYTNPDCTGLKCFTNHDDTALTALYKYD